jgi:hypothetical protein
MLNFYALHFQIYKTIFRPKYEAPSSQSGFTSTPLDTEATLLGNAYRGSGILIGILGALILFCAVAPIGFGLLHDSKAIYFGIAEVALMAWVIQTMFFVNAGQLKERWIVVRKQAEKERYQSLQHALSGDMAALVAAVSPLLTGTNCQIAYNKERHDQYHAIEKAAAKTTFIGFAISLVAAIAHIFIHADALIFFTAALPASVGALHGINAFLHLEELAEEHQQMFTTLVDLSVSFQQSVQDSDLGAARSLATDIHGLLAQSHQTWISIASRLEVRAP